MGSALYSLFNDYVLASVASSSTHVARACGHDGVAGMKRSEETYLFRMVGIILLTNMCGYILASIDVLGFIGDGNLHIGEGICVETLTSILAYYFISFWVVCLPLAALARGCYEIEKGRE